MATKKRTSKSASSKASTAAKKTDETKPAPKSARTEVKDVHRVIPQRFSAEQYANLRSLPAGAGKALQATTGDRVWRTEQQWQEVWRKIASAPA